MAARRILALNLLLLPAELVHRLGVLRHVAAVSLALDRVADEVAAFLLFAGLATVGFAGTLTAQIRGVPAYSQFTRSCRELLLAALGEMNFDDIVDTQLFWGPTLLTLYLVCVAVTLLNLLIAVLEPPEDERVRTAVAARIASETRRLA